MPDIASEDRKSTEASPKRTRAARRSALPDLASLLRPDPVMPVITRINVIARNFSDPLYEWVQQEFGVSRPDYVTVYNVRRTPGITAQDISVRTGFKKNTVSAAVHRLVKLDMLRRVRDDEDDRRYHLFLRPRGEALYDAVNPRFKAAEDAVVAGLSEPERRTLERLLGTVLDTLIRSRHAEAAGPANATTPETR